MRRKPGIVAVMIAGTAMLAASQGCLNESERESESPYGVADADGESWVEAWDTTAGPNLPGIDEIDEALGLTDEQRATVETALATLQEACGERQSQRGGGRRGPGGRQGPRGPGGGDCDGKGAGGGGGRHGLPGAFGDREPPLLAFFETVVPVLEVAQVEALADLMQEHRDAAGESGRPRGPRGGGGFGGLLRCAGSELGLDDEQRDAVMALMKDKRDEFRELRKSFAEGTISAEQVRDSSRELRLEIEEALQGILSEEQYASLEDLFAEHRAERAQSRIDRLGEGMERRLEFQTAVLGLDGGQSASVQSALESSLDERRAVLEALRDGEIDIEEALYRGYNLAQETTAAIAALLDGEQARIHDALQQLLPGGGRRS